METSPDLFDTTPAGHITFAQCEAEKAELFSLSNKELLTYFLLLAIFKALIAVWNEEAFWEKLFWKIPQGYGLTGLFYFGCRVFITRGLVWPYGHLWTTFLLTCIATTITIGKLVLMPTKAKEGDEQTETYDFIAKRQKGQN